MPADLESLTARVAACLQDATQLVYPSDAITEGLRQVLADISTALNRSQALAGLDGAGETTLPDGLTGLVVQAAAAITVSGRALRHAEQPALSPEGLPPAALGWSEKVLERFRLACERLRSACLRGESVPWVLLTPGGGAGWPLDEHDGQVF
jgi:ABC-type uncharacterized transport system ATPase subunit